MLSKLTTLLGELHVSFILQKYTPDLLILSTLYDLINESDETDFFIFSTLRAHNNPPDLVDTYPSRSMFSCSIHVSFLSDKMLWWLMCVCI